ncbi:hypothetical protein VCUG_00221 [Vavraia culicis subsp. floridensis]|uniref:BAR domain-containing protein n=1 Tax=Vavraia culicis (isolate floridensis) TaxID=948595 RepID=L2GZ91_VAVCU|nr:uncharacterized protein VCUG_00221 [Vavraia culicis subsp. floridensis]ELA48385.1 hypothetical protein VCUG_00221 [Vavraia culicis subsp. floridensis]
MQSRFKNLLRKVDRIDYVNADFPAGYEKTEEDYRIVKNKMENLKNTFLHFMTYEHGGRAYKTAMRAIEVVGRRVKKDSFEVRSFYKETELTGREIAKVQSNDSLKSLAEKYSDAFSAVEDAKIKMNEEYEEIIKQIKELQDSSRTIDEKRANVLNLRYDLEKMYKKKSPGNEDLDNLKTEFNQEANLVKEEMKGYVGGKGVSEVIRRACRAMATFSKEAAAALETVK